MASKLDLVLEAKDIYNTQRLNEHGPAIDGLGPVKTVGLPCKLEADCCSVGSLLKRLREHFRERHMWDLDMKFGRPS